MKRKTRSAKAAVMRPEYRSRVVQDKRQTAQAEEDDEDIHQMMTRYARTARNVRTKQEK